jgi:hypothetical protein
MTNEQLMADAIEVGILIPDHMDFDSNIPF